MISLAKELVGCWNCNHVICKAMDVKFPSGTEQIQVCQDCECPRSFADLVVLENYEMVTGKEISATMPRFCRFTAVG